MEFKKIELVNVPEVHEHKVEIAKVTQIVAKDLQIGDLILFGFHLQLIENIEVYDASSKHKILQNKSSIE